MQISRIWIFLTLGLLLTFNFSQAEEEAVTCSESENKANLNFTLQDMFGDQISLRDYAGNVILLDFWATWCAPCRIEIPGFIELLDKYESQGLVILGISVDDPVDALTLYAEEMSIDYPILIGNGRDDVKASFGPLIGFPTSFLITKDGNICHKHTGFAPKAQFEQEILSLL